MALPPGELACPKGMTERGKCPLRPAMRATSPIGRGKLALRQIIIYQQEATMNRILIIGCSGAGKSTLARQLGSLTGLPVTVLKNRREAAKFLEQVASGSFL